MLNLISYFATFKTSFRGSLSVDLFVQKQKHNRFFEINEQKNHRLHTSNCYIQNVLKVCLMTAFRIAKGIISLHQSDRPFQRSFQNRKKENTQGYYRITANTSEKIKASGKKIHNSRPRQES